VNVPLPQIHNNLRYDIKSTTNTTVDALKENISNPNAPEAFNTINYWLPQ
jgi:hypothetical protein